MRASLNRMFAIMKKEVAHIVRDPFTATMALGLPVAMLLIFGTAFEFNLDHIKLAVRNEDHSAASRALVESFASSGHFDVVPLDGSDHPVAVLDRGQAMATLQINPGFERDLGSSGQGVVQIIIDGSDNTSAGSILSYLPQIQGLATQKLLPGTPVPEPIKVQSRFQFNPELNSQWFIIPGLGVTIMAILSILLTSLTVAREWETGSMELLLSTPVRPIEIIIGKLGPYLLLGLGGLFFIYLSARVVFGVPFRGDLLVYGAASLIFITACMAQGLLISVVTRSQPIAMQYAMISGLLPSMFLSGFIYPIEHMPTFFSYLTTILAARWFMDLSRALYLKGSGLSELTVPFGALSLVCLIVIGLAALKFKRDVEP